MINREKRLTVEFRKVFYAMPACFLAGVLAGACFMGAYHEQNETVIDMQVPNSYNQAVHDYRQDTKKIVCVDKRPRQEHKDTRQKGYYGP
jgi:hypothetical protein